MGAKDKKDKRQNSPSGLLRFNTFGAARCFDPCSKTLHANFRILALKRQAGKHAASDRILQIKRSPALLVVDFLKKPDIRQ